MSSNRKSSRQASRSNRIRLSGNPIRRAIESLESRRLLDGTGLLAQYFNTTDLTGTPVSRVDANVNFNWTNGAPDNALNPDNYTARWTGKVQANYSETYTFSVNVTGGARLWVNGTQLINQWTATGTNTFTGNIALTAGTKYDIQLEYAEKTGNAAVSLSWSSASQSQQVIPQSALYSWTDLEIGSPATAGSSSYDSSTGVLTVNGSGSYLSSSSDSAHYVLQQMDGDVEIIARLTNVASSSTMVGLTIRNSTVANDKAADMLMWGGGAWFFARDTVNTKVFGHNTNNLSTPLWMRLVRLGNTLTGYYSTDGVEWIAQWGRTVTMGSTVQVGFVVSSLSSSLTTATFDNISVGSYKSSYSTSWVGNTNNGAGQWVPNDMKGIYVDPVTGTIFTNSPYDEGGYEAAAYQNGQNIGGFEDLHGWSRAGGWGIVADDNYVYLTMSQGSMGYVATGYPDPGTGWQCIRRYSRSTFRTAGWTGGSGWDSSMIIVNTNGLKLTGLTMIGNNLYVSDPTTNQVKIYNKTTMTYVGAFSVDRPGHMAVDASSNLWIVSYADDTNAAKVLKYDSSGNKLTPEITGVESPTGIAYNPATGQLLVADDGPRQQVLKYSDLTAASPTLVGTLGDYGGITSGTIGQITPTKFDNPGIVAADNAGNIYVGFNGLNVKYTNASLIGIGAVLRSFNSSGTMNWEMRGLEFVDSGAVDPTTDGMDIYTKDEHFAANYSVTGTEMGTWVGRTVAESTNPTDSRLSGGDTSVWIKTLAGQSFMFTTGQAGMALTIYKKVPGTELWQQCATIQETRYEGSTYATIWRDTNNDGVKQSSEVVATNAAVKEDGFGFDIDSQGNVWSIGYYSGLRKYAFTGLDAYGNPSYSSTVTSPNKTTIFNMIGRSAYDAATDTMYLAGWTPANPIGSAGWGVAGSTIARYDNWSNATPTLAWSTVLPYNPSIAHVAKAISLSGNRLFVGYVDTATVRAYDTTTGALVEDMTRGPEIGGYGGWLDTSQPINSFRRSNGEYVITVEDDLFGKVFIMRAGGIMPTNLTATAASSSQINLSWTDNDSKESGFVVQRSTDGTNFTDIATLPANMTSYSATGLSTGVTYYFRVRANNSFDNSPWSSIASATPTGSTPAAPSSLSATAASSTQINLTWTDNSSNETGFSIDRATNSTFTTGLVTTTVGANVTSSNITGLSASTTYYFRVKATGSSGDSAYTATANATTQAAIPSAPSGLSATTASSSQINLSWTDNSSNETGFSIDCATNSTFTTGLVTTTVGAGVTSSNITGLSASTTYYFRVKATGSSGDSAYTATASATTQAAGTPAQLTGTIIGVGGVYANNPFNTRAAALDGNLSTFYDADSASSAWLGYDLGTAKQITSIKYAPRDGYSSRMTGGVFQGSNTSDFSSGVVTLYTISSAPTTGSLTTQTVTDTGTYRYVRYMGPTNGYCNVAEVQFFGLDLTAPAAPSGLSATAASSSQINLSWTDNSSNETGFAIDRATDAGFTTNLVTTTVGANVTSANITGLAESTLYYFRVRATNSAGSSANSTAASTSTPASLPAAPSGLSATAASSSQINLSWTDNSSNETGFAIDRATDAGFTANLVTTTVGANVTSANITGLSASTTYYFRVRATNSAGSSANSTAASATTQSASIGIFTIAQDIGTTGATGSTSYNSGTGVYTILGSGADLWLAVDSFHMASSSVTGDAAISAGVTSFTGTSQTWAKAGVTFRDSTATNAMFAIAYARPDGTVTFQWRATTGGNVQEETSSTTYGTTGFPKYVRIARSGNVFAGYYSTDGSTWTQIGTATATIAMSSTASAGLFVCSHAAGTLATATFSNVSLVTPPAAPSGLSATTASSSQINLSWTDNASNESGFTIDRATDSGFTANLTTVSVAANSTSYNATGLSANTTYYFRVRATNSAGASANTTAASATTLPTAPAAPTGLSATTASATQINLSWTDNASNETGFSIDRATDSGFTANLVTNTVGADVTAYNATGLTANTTYYFRVRATNTGGNSAYTSTASATTLPTAPTAPSGLSATAASTSQINLSWTDNASNETGFSIDRATDSGFTANLVTNTVGADVTAYNATGLTANTTYYFRVRATNTGGNSAYTSTASATTQTSGTSTQLTGTIIGVGGVYANNPNNTRAAALDGNLSTFYDADSASSAWLGYDLGTAKQITSVKYAPRSGGYAFRMTGGVFQGSNTSDFSSGVVTLYTISSAPADGSLTTQTVTDTGTYRYVRYMGPTDGYCNVAEVQFFGTDAPAAPSGLSATAASSSQINLSWTDNASNETGFSIDRATDSSFTTNLVTTTVGENVTSSNITGLSASTTYYFRVRATNSAGASANTATASATTQAPTSSQLTGTLIGAGGTYGNDPNNGPSSAVDGNLSTFYDASSASGAWVGLDLGTAMTITSIKYAPRPSWGSRMVGGVFQVSNTADFSSGVVTIYTVDTAPTAGVLTTQSVSVSGTYRYVRYLSPTNGYCNVAEVQFFGY